MSKAEFVNLINCIEKDDVQYLFSKSRDVADEFVGKKIYVRGLIKFTNFCKNDCYYCGIRRSNLNAQRYRLNKDEILACCKQGYELGLRIFVYRKEQSYES